MASAAFAAEDIPLSTMTCKQFVGAPKEFTAVILTWMMGFLQDVEEPAVISFSKMEALGNKLKNHCDQNPSQPLMTALDKVTDQDSK